MVTGPEALAPVDVRSRYGDTLRRLNERKVPYLVGGTYALSHYTGICRPTKDLDLFVRRTERDLVLAALRTLGWQTRVSFPHWLAKARRNGDSIDVIHGSGNGLASVDDAWFDHARYARLPGLDVGAWVVPPEEMIFSKAFVMEKYRYDGADVAHLLLRQGPGLDWDRLLRRFGLRFRVLFAHLVLFEYIYPGRNVVPADLFGKLAARVGDDEPAEAGGAAECRGVLLSRKQYTTDTADWGYKDARRDPDVEMTGRDIETWSAAPAAPPGPDAES